MTLHPLAYVLGFVVGLLSTCMILFYDEIAEFVRGLDDEDRFE